MQYRLARKDGNPSRHHGELCCGVSGRELRLSLCDFGITSLRARKGGDWPPGASSWSLARGGSARPASSPTGATTFSPLAGN